MAKPADTKTTAASGGTKGAAKTGAARRSTPSGSAGKSGAKSAAGSTGEGAATKGTAGKSATTKTATKSAGTKSAGTRSGAAKSAASTSAAAKSPDTKGGGTRGATAKSAAVKNAPAKSARKGGATNGEAPPKRARSAAETERIRIALEERREELREEYDQHLAEIAELQRDRLTDSAGDDQADTGSKTFEREQEISLANSILERITQVERALERLAEGSYGWCERCGSAIPVERLAAFPSATLCVRCKQLEERR
jgi:RNA polymerase-binding protein DksA